MTHPRVALSLFLLIALIAVVSVRVHPLSLRLMKNGSVDFSAAQALFVQQIRTSGPQAAQRLYLDTGHHVSSSAAHDLAHAFGAALYSELGDSGLTYCTSDFVFGCYHQFIGSALIESGLDAAGRFGALCDTLPGNDRAGCMHGVGHGLVGYVGYGLNDLVSVLSTCSTMNPGDPRNLCADGAFMEYNLHELSSLGTSLVQPRPLTRTNLYSPCDDTALAKYKEACAFELPIWWITADTASLNGRERVNRAAERCRRIGDVRERRACIQGLGDQIAAIHEYDAPSIADDCSTVSENVSDRLACLTGALWRAAANRAGTTASCALFGLSGQELAYCTNVSQMSRGQSDTVPVPGT